MKNQYYVYIMANHRPTLYVGMTNDLPWRAYQHRNDLIEGFTTRYQLHKLVYFEETSDVNEAISREKQLKRWHRDWKLNLVKSVNPGLMDLYPSIVGYFDSILKQVQDDSMKTLEKIAQGVNFLEVLPDQNTQKLPALIDTHAHIHQDSFDDDRGLVMQRAADAGVTKILCVATGVEDSKLAIKLAQSHDNLWATVGLHPHDTKLGQPSLDALKALASEPKVVAIGECGLDYFYNHSPKEDQLKAFKFQIELAQEVNKPLVFHVREAFDDFFDVVGEYKNLRGVVHCFTGDTATLNKVLDHGFYVALNGIMTFTKDQAQLDAAKAVPLDRLLLETDCPFLTPAPHRGQRNEPANIKVIAEFLAELRGESFEELAAATTKNAEVLFGI